MRDKGLTDFERQKLLSIIIDNGWMNKSDIKYWIGFLIEDMGERFQNAAEKWRRDIAFVTEYIIALNSVHSKTK